MASPSFSWIPRSPVLVGLAFLILVPAAAVAEDAPRKPAKPGEGFKFSPPDETPTPSGTVPATAPPRTPADPISVAVATLARWPGPEGMRAVETLMLLGPDAIAPLLRALDGSDPSVRPGAAFVLGQIGGPEHVPAIMRAAAQREQGSRLEVFFEAAKRLDEKGTKRWLFSWLAVLDRPVFRRLATEFLIPMVVAEDRAQIENLLRARQGPIRITGLELLARTGAPEAVDRLFGSLPDPQPEVAKRAGQLLASMDDPKIVARLNALVREGDARQRPYATLALVELARRTRMNPIERTTLAEMAGRRGLAHPDRLDRAAAAVGLAYGGIDVDDPVIAALLDREVFDELILTVRGDHFLDYGSVVDPVFAALRRLSGLDLPSTAQPWEQWWAENRGKFRARRLLTAVSDDDLLKARVVVDRVDAEGRRRGVAFVPQGGVAFEDALVLPAPVFRALVKGLEEAGIFGSGDDVRSLSEPHLAVRLGVLNQERRMAVLPGGEDGRHATLSARVDALEEANVWQRYRDVDRWPDAAGWRKAQAEFFATAEPDVRRTALVRLVVFSFDDLPSDAARGDALDLLDGWKADLSDAEALHLLTWAARSPSLGAVESRVVERIAALERSTLSEPLVEALSASPAPPAQRLLAKALSDGGVLRVREAFADPRPGVRVASAAASILLLESPGGRDEIVRRRLADSLTGGLRALMVDPIPLVRVRSATALAMLSDPGALEKLEDLFREGETSVRIAVAEGLGHVSGSEVRRLLVRIVGEVGPGSAPVRSAALGAMAKIGDADAVRVLAFYMLNDSDEGVRTAAEAALVTVRTDDARFALVDLLTATKPDAARRVRVLRALSTYDGEVVRDALGRHLEDTDPRVVDQAALGLARLNDAAAFPYLLAILRRIEEPAKAKALEALQDLTCFTLVVTGYEAAADQYETWWRSRRTLGDRSWFREALQKRGYDVGTLEPYVRGEADLKAVPLLLRAIRDDDPSIRRGAEIALRRMTGRNFGGVERGTPRDQLRSVADRWSAWWALQPAAAATK
jgi:HEAT repeat protein